MDGGCHAWLWGGLGDDVLVGGASGQEIRGGDGDDHLYGRGGNDVLYGDGTHRTIGNDVIDGGAGSDTAAWGDRPSGIRADLERGRETSSGESDRLHGLENLVGTPSPDVLAGDDGPNRLLGSGGRDLLVGRGGDDLLDGGNGSLLAVGVDDDAPDHFRCGGGRDQISYPGSAALPIGCEWMDDPHFLRGKTIPVRPRPAPHGSVDVRVVCDPTSACRRRVVVTAGNRTLGQTRLIDEPGPTIRVHLQAAAPADRSVHIVVEGDDARFPYRFEWQLNCRGAPPDDICRAGR